MREGRLLAGPETLQVNLGNRCNLACTFCWSHSPLRPAYSEAWQRERLGAEHLDRIVDSLPRLRPGRLQLSGRGEPLLHPEVERLLEAARAAAVPVSIQTNGVGGLEPEAFRRLGVDSLLVNVSAGTPEGYERTHPGQGHLLERVAERLERVAGSRDELGRPRVQLVAVVQRTNREELLPLVELARRVGAIGLELKGMELEEGLEDLMLDAEERAATLGELERAEALARETGLRVESTHLRRLLSRQGPTGAFTDDLWRGPCYMGWYYLRVTSAGEAMFCCKDKPVGHLDEGSLYETWRSPSYHLHRLAARDGDPATGLFDRKCRSCSNFARNRELGRELGAAAPLGGRG